MFIKFPTLKISQFLTIIRMKWRFQCQMQVQLKKADLFRSPLAIVMCNLHAPPYHINELTFYWQQRETLPKHFVKTIVA